MAQTKVQIISFALSVLGKKLIINLDNQSDITSAAEQAFDFLLPAILSKGQWRFATKIVQLNQLVTTPIVDNWNYIYQIPSDYLKLQRLYPHNYDYEMYENNHLYSNVDNPLHLEYIYQPVPSRLPPYFTQYLSYEIANNLALSNAKNVSFKQTLKEEAGIAMATGLAADAQNRPNQGIVSAPIISNRGIGFSGNVTGLGTDG